MHNKIILGILAAVVIAVGITAAATYSKKTSRDMESSGVKQSATTNEESMESSETAGAVENGHTLTPDEAAMMEKDKMEAKETEGSMQKNETTTAEHGSYKDYSPEVVASEQKSGHKVVLFFHAKWCPFCKAADLAFIEKIAQIPSSVTVLKTDYDQYTALKQKYAVTYQHTFVQIDNNQNLVTKWSGGDVDNLKKYLK